MKKENINLYYNLLCKLVTSSDAIYVYILQGPTDER